MASHAPRERVVRVRQRDRATSLLGFDPSFEPQLHEWRVDKLVLSIGGRWRATGAETGFELFENRLSDAYAQVWLLPPSVSRFGISVKSRSGGPLTISSLQIKATGCSAREGKLSIELKVNPTRTLASLMERFGLLPDFRARMFVMDPITFFEALAADAMPPSLDGGTNYLPERPDLRETLGDDPFFVFLPIFLQQLQSLVERVFSEFGEGGHFDQAEQVFSTTSGEIRLDWETPHVPQVETYFERFHRDAEAVVRIAGTAIIDGDPATSLRSYPGGPVVGRTADSFRVGINLDLDQRHSLAVYAKTENRIRFEFRRWKRGRYSEPTSELVGSQPRQYAAMLHILFDVERRNAQRMVRWSALFDQFAEPDAPSITDLTELISKIVSATTGDGEGVFRRVLHRLIVDGGISSGIDPFISERTIQRLLRTGVIERLHLRRRQPGNQPKRYRLVSNSQWMRQRLLAALAEGTG